MDRIQELLGRLTELNNEELAELEAAILAEFEANEQQDPTAETVEAMTALADALDSVRGEQGTRAEQAAEIARKASEARDRVRSPQAVPADEPAAVEDEVPAEEPVAVAAAAEEPAEEEAPETVVAAADEPAAEPENQEEPVTASGEIVPPASHQAKPKPQAQLAITAGADIPGYTAGSPLSDMKSVAEAMVARLRTMGRASGGDGEQHIVASIVSSFPEERTLRASDQTGNMAKIEAVTSRQAIVAAGGLCAPVEVRYDVFGLGGLGRPVKDSLPGFSADRGGIRYISPPVLTDLDGSVSLWTVQDDIDAATDGAPDPTKPCLRVACGDEVTVLSDAIPLCLTFGNMGARAYPEMVARHTELGMIWHARYAETRLLTRIGTLSTQVSAARNIGAASDFFSTLSRAAAAYRNRHRMNEDDALRVIAPSWLKDEFQADLAMRMPGDNVEANLAAADSLINSFFSVRSINVTWSLDGEDGQVFGSQADGSLLDFPSSVVWYLFAEGTFLFLDGGTLDLGLVRDSTLNSTNDYKMFVETFEGVAKIGVESLRVEQALAPTGAVAGTVDTNS